MPEEFDFQKLKKQYPEFFKEFPVKLIELASSDKTASQISEACLKNRIEDKKTIEKIAYCITSVLLGRLPLEILPKALATTSKIDDEVAEKISEEANQLIFSQVKDSLAKLYSAEEKPTPSTKEESKEEKPKRPPRKDTYREPIE